MRLSDRLFSLALFGVSAIFAQSQIPSGGGGGSLSLTATLPVVITPSPCTTAGCVVSAPTAAIGPGSSTANHLAEFSGTDGVTLIDGGASYQTQAKALATGILKNTTSTGAPSIATSADVIATFSTCSGTQYLGADGACHTGNSGTVTTVGFTGGIVTVATATTTPAFTIAGTSGGVPYFSSASTWASSAAGTSGHLMLWGGAGSAPTDGGSPAVGTVTSIATTSPITGGTITSTGTIACATCVTSAASLTSGQGVFGSGSQGTQTSADWIDSSGVSLTAAVSVIGTANATSFVFAGHTSSGLGWDGFNSTIYNAGSRILIATSTGANAATPMNVNSTSTSYTFGLGVLKSASAGTFICEDVTASTGSTLCAMQSGAGQSGPVLAVKSSNATVGGGTNTFSVTAAGTILQSAQISCSTGLTTDGSGNINGCVASDERLKTNIRSIDASSALMKLTPRLYDWRADANKDSSHHAGFIAQEVGKVFPAAMVSAGNGYQGVDPNAILALTVKAIQEIELTLHRNGIK